MANTKQAIKRVRQNNNRRIKNTQQQSSLRTSIKKAQHALNSKESTAKESVKAAVIHLDSMAGKQMIHKNRAARLKSRLNKKLKNLSTPS